MLNAAPAIPTPATTTQSLVRKTGAFGGKRRTRILFLIPSLGVGGAEIQLLSLVKGLDKNRYEIAVAVFYGGGALEAQFRAVNDVSIVCLGKKHGLHFGHLSALCGHLGHENYDILQPYNVSARLIGILAARKYSVPFTVVTERNAKAVYTSLGSRIYYFLEKLAVRKANLLVSNSQAGREFAISQGMPADRVRVVPNGIETSRLRAKMSRAEICALYTIPNESLIVGMVARMTPQKDHRSFLHAAQIVAQEMPAVRFMLVGDGPEFKKTRALAGRLSLGERVIFAGKVENIADHLNAMDLVLLTSRKSEGCSNALLEAMALGKPVIATRVPGNIELIEEGVAGRLVNPQRPEELAAASIDLLQNAALRRALGEAGKSMVQKRYSHQAMVISYEKIYDELMIHQSRIE